MVFLALFIACFFFFFSCSALDLIIVQILQFAFWIWARPSSRGFPFKTVDLKKEILRNLEVLKTQVCGYSLVEVKSLVNGFNH